MHAHSQLVQQIIADPHDNSLRLQLADLLIADGDLHGQVMRWQCELENLTEADAGWYSRSYQLANLLRGINPFLSLQSGDSMEAKISSELHAIKVDDKNVGRGTIERGFVNAYSVFDVARLKSCEPAVIQAAPLICSLEFSELKTSEQFQDLTSLNLLSQATGLTFAKCEFSADDFDRLFNHPALAKLTQLTFKDCKFTGGIQRLAGTRVAQQLERLSVTIGKEEAEELQASVYLGDLFPESNLPKLASLELNLACTTRDLIALQAWPELSKLRELELRGQDLPASSLKHLLECDLSSLQTLRVSGFTDKPATLDFSRCRALKVLSIKGLELDEGVMRSLGQSLPLSLEQLTLGNCQLSSSAVAAWLGGKALRNLRVLNLQVNQLDGDCLRQLASTEWLSGLVALKLSFNPLGDEAGAILSGSTVLKGLAFLDLSETGIGDQSALVLFSSPNSQSLQWLNLDGNAITGASLATLLSPAHLPNIVALRLKSNDLWNDHKRECIQRFGKGVVDSYFLGYLI